MAVGEEDRPIILEEGLVEGREDQFQATQTDYPSPSPSFEPPSYFHLNGDYEKHHQPSVSPGAPLPAYLCDFGESLLTGSGHSTWTAPATLPKLQTFTIEDFDIVPPKDNEPLPTYAQDCEAQRNAATAPPPLPRSRRTLIEWVVVTIVSVTVTMGPSVAYLPKSPHGG